MNTNASGLSTASTFTANGTAGAFNVAASANSGAPTAAVALSNTAGSPALMTITAGNNQSTLVGTAFASALQVRVTDAHGNPLSGVAVTFTGTTTTPAALHVGVAPDATSSPFDVPVTLEVLPATANAWQPGKMVPC